MTNRKFLRRHFDNSLLRLLSGTGSIKLLNTGLGFIVSMLLARTLGASQFGLYSFAIVVASICGVVTQLGLPRLVMRETAYALSEKNWGAMRALWRWATAITLFLSALIFAGIVLVTLVWGGDVPRDRTVLLFAGLIIPFASLSAINGGALRGLHHVVTGLFPDLGFRQMVLIALLLLSGSLGIAVDARLAVIFYIIAAASAFTLSGLLLSRHTPASASRHRPASFDPSWLSTAAVFSLTAGILQINNYTDIFLIGVLSDDANVGHYRVAQQFSFLPIIGLQIVGTSFSPRFAELWRQRKITELEHIFRLSVRLSVIGAVLPLVVLLAIGNRIIPAIFGTEFDASFAPMVALLIGKSIFASVGPASGLLNMMGKQRINAMLSAVAALANVALNVLLIPMLGIIGAGIATAVSQALLALVTFRIAYRGLIRPEADA